MAKSKVKFDLKKALTLATKKHLAKAKEKAGSGGFDEFDDGKYVMRCEGGELGQSASSDRFQATMFWKFTDGDYKGKPYRSYQGLDTEDGWTYFLRDLGRLGYDTTELEDFSEVLPILKELKKEKPTCRVTLKSSGEFQNLRIQRLIDPDEVDDEDDDEEDDDEKKSSKKKKTAKKKKPADDDDDDDESDDDDSDDDDESDDDDDSDDDDEEDETPKKKSKKVAKKKKKPADDDDDDEESDDDDEDENDDDEDADEDDEDEVALSIGSTVKVRTKAGVKKGEVTEVLEDDNKIKVKFSDGKVLTLSAEKIVSVEDVPSAKKKTAKKKVKK